MKTYPRQRAKPSPKIKEGYPLSFIVNTGLKRF